MFSSPYENERITLKTNKGLVPKKVKSITFTFVSQFGANFEIKFLIVY